MSSINNAFETTIDSLIANSTVSKDDIKRMIALLKKALDSIPKDRIEYKN